MRIYRRIKFKKHIKHPITDKLVEQPYSLHHVATIDYIFKQMPVGNIYVNRNMIGAVIGVQPFGGERFSGTDPKAGGHITYRVYVLNELFQLIPQSLSPYHIDQPGILSYLQSLPGVTAIHDLHIWRLSTKEIALTIHLVMPEHSLLDADFVNINNLLKSKYRIDHATLQVEKGHKNYPCERSARC